MTTTTLSDVAAAGEAFKAVLAALADEDKDEVLRLINTADEAQLRWLAAWSALGMRDMASLTLKPNRVRRALMAAARGVNEDVWATQIAHLNEERSRG